MLTKENGFTFPWRFPISFDREAAFAFVALFVTLLLVYSNSFQGEWHFDDFHQHRRQPMRPPVTCQPG